MMHRIMLVVAAASALTSAPLRAQRERYAPLVVQLPLSARSLSLGGGTAILRDADAALGNPALVGLTTAYSLTVARYSADAKSGVLAGTGTIGNFGIGIGVQYLDYFGTGTTFPPASSALRAGGTVGSSSMAGTLAAAMNFKGMRWGAAAKFLEERTGDARAAVSALDLGVQKDAIFNSFSAGLAIQNIGPDLSIHGIDARLPLRAALGFSGGGLAIGPWIDLGATATLAVRRDGFFAPSAGAEMSYQPIEGITFAARLGLRRPELRELNPFTAGAGASFDRLTVDYAWESLKGGTGSHRVTLRVR